jgi:hypothetical protein
VSSPEVRLRPRDARALLRARGWQRSTGLHPGTHWRKRDGAGCLHMRRHAGAYYLHRDEADPARRPVEHAAEVIEHLLGWTTAPHLAGRGGR